MSGQDRLWQVIGRTGRGVLATIKRDGRPQLSNVDYLAGDGVIRFSSTADRAKVRNLRRDPRASFYVTTPGGGTYAVAEGLAELSAIAAEPFDAAVEELVELYREIRGEHPDWAEYRAAMVADGRLAVRIHVDRLYGWLG
ncbi:PPOX class F420-dependent oxidoreductase [Catellatospora coxensis]|uniref:PPOX class F420-dependent enzyme n=1 Tax=Catellatospora coxensis TaxID=310354 RepID=A0A8J3KYF2_9ACTN|nr:PPOX class F420-dependent oxidoreductase [Catellatospora coxensis]GIG07754.1 PPOX class F420-dependent enzyme [Catellatospora coxensis]